MHSMIWFKKIVLKTLVRNIEVFMPGGKYQMMFSFFSESGYGYYRYGGYRYNYGYRHGYYGKRGMKKIASRQPANNVHAELNDDARMEHLKENFAEVERNKAQLKAAHQ